MRYVKLPHAEASTSCLLDFWEQLFPMITRGGNIILLQILNVQPFPPDHNHLTT